MIGSALFGFVGVILGALIAGGSQYVLDRRRERATIAREQRTAAIEIMRAARMIDLDLSAGETAAYICIEKRHWWTEAEALTTEYWRLYCSVIAPNLSWSDWTAIRVGAAAVNHLAGARERYIAAGLTGVLTDADIADLRPMQRDIVRGRTALAQLHGLNREVEPEVTE